MGRALVDAPAIGECFDQKQSAAADFFRSARADLAFEPGALIDDFAANDLLVELKSEDDLATSMHQALLTSSEITSDSSLSRSG